MTKAPIAKISTKMSDFVKDEGFFSASMFFIGQLLSGCFCEGNGFRERDQAASQCARVSISEKVGK
jgi:hypothetical protein